MAVFPITISLPNASLFTIHPSNDPIPLAPPVPGSSSTAPPFEIPQWLYTAALETRVPITIAAVYAVTVTALNAYNRQRKHRPWPISRTRAFFWFVAAHNIFLAVYSAWTFVGMLCALRRSIVSPLGPSGLVGTVDSFCQMHGSTGLENALAYDPTSSRWLAANLPTSLALASPLSLPAGVAPAAQATGRLWNEGLAFYGWIFYLSKFYEVIDTLVILAKGKRSSTLQKYHHAGAMMCMWAGMRYMSPPVWMFVLVNSGIHALMYTYYTLTAFSVAVPRQLKRTLTSMQIIQFIVGVIYAAIHSFVSYTTPSSTSAPSTTTSCLSTTGQTFAMWLNVMYLLPLMALFTRFFVKSYLRMPAGASSSAASFERASQDARKGVDRLGGKNAHHANGRAVL